MKKWELADIPDQSGRIAVVTGANTGLGYQTARALAKAGATVVMAARSADKGEAAAKRVQAEVPSAKVEFSQLDLADLKSVDAFVDRVASHYPHIDLLINNAGVMTPRTRQVTTDGFELQLGVNFLGHFALTLRLLPTLSRAKSARVVNLSSIMHKWGHINFDDLMCEKRYSPVPSYSQSKLATLLFARELQRRSEANAWGITSVAAHPGIARTELTKSRPGQQAMAFNRISDIFAPLFTGTAADGALPSLYAATSDAIQPGGYYGPTGLFEIRGTVGVAKSSGLSLDQRVAERLWTRAEYLVANTGR